MEAVDLYKFPSFKDGDEGGEGYDNLQILIQKVDNGYIITVSDNEGESINVFNTSKLVLSHLKDVFGESRD